MLSKEVLISTIDLKFHCPYCKKLICDFSENESSTCEHLIFIYDDDDVKNFYEVTDDVKNAYERMKKSADPDLGLEFEDFVNMLTFEDDVKDSIAILLEDDISYYGISLWFGFRLLK